MKHLLHLLLVVLSTTAFAQGTIITRDRQRIDYEELKIKYNNFHITLADGQEKMIEDSLIYGYFQKNPVPGYLSPDRGIFHYFFKVKAEASGKLNYKEMRRSLSGKVGLYHVIITGSSGGTTLTYLVKNDTAVLLPTGKANMIKQLTKYVSDNPEALTMLDPKKFKADWDQSYIKDVLRSYNLASVSQPQSSSTDSTELTIYRRAKGKDLLSLTIGANAYTLKDQDFIRIKIPSETWLKVCLETKDGQVCDVVEAPPHFSVYYEVVQSPSYHTYSFQLQPSTAAIADIKTIEKSVTKNKD